MTSTAKRGGSTTVTDVARVAGVSRATAARALGGYGSVSAASAEAVRAAAEALGYRVNRVARSMITGRTRTIGVVLSDIENDFFVRALRGISHVARERGYDVLLANTDEDVDLERDAVEVMRGRRVEGLVVCPADVDDAAHLLAAVDSGASLVLLDRTVAGLSVQSVGIDNRQAGYDATKFLLDAGHTRIAILSGVKPEIMRRALAHAPDQPQLGETPAEGRVVGHYRALLEAGVQPDELLQVPAEFHRIAASEAVTKLLESGADPTAILTSDSIQTLGALHAIRAAGYVMPDDISLLGFDDSEWAPVVQPPITVIEQPAYEIGTRAAESLINRIEGEAGSPEVILLPTTLIERGSVVVPRA
ncbi:MAG: LacI family DNA-binding transcriptional regulator [Ornithinimicrobium sp.]|uniref:LacI family DNA-binding transcriptional regulator n=1 Tax=Ornithinimicrobium sp. TaxID=1977084 RepID=UPI0026DF4B7C|nr:LacI family DNA-binding transcriptional regulator [Ornithinimicrobium sp.]MDO5738781.1 LacI family DNA-binding transcriptional regulator [Ornithinimicrobium sp.]